VLFVPREIFGDVYSSGSALQLRYALAGVLLFGGALAFFLAFPGRRDAASPKKLEQIV
jgi:hypothetical protein